MSLVRALLFLLVLISPLGARELDTCTAPRDSPIRDHADARVRATYHRVLDASGLPGRFAICEFPGIVARIVLVRLPEKEVTVVFLPSYAAAFSDDALEGLIAHEVGHVPTWFQPLTGVDDEKRADKQGKAWVGERPMLAFLAAMRKEAHRAPTFVQPMWYAEMNQRIDALLYPAKKAGP